MTFDIVGFDGPSTRPTYTAGRLERLIVPEGRQDMDEIIEAFADGSGVDMVVEDDGSAVVSVVEDQGDHVTIRLTATELRKLVDRLSGIINR